jgi:hypothetical protein
VEVARQAYAATMAGKDHVVAGDRTCRPSPDPGADPLTIRGAIPCRGKPKVMAATLLRRPTRLWCLTRSGRWRC